MHLLLGPHTPHFAQVQDSQAELVATGRPTCRDPLIPRYLCEELFASITPNMHAVIEACDHPMVCETLSQPNLLLLPLSLPHKYLGPTHYHRLHPYYCCRRPKHGDYSTHLYPLTAPLAVQPGGRLARVEPTPFLHPYNITLSSKVEISNMS